MPGVLQCAGNDLPLAALLRECFSATRRDPVVTTTPAAGRRIPGGLDVAQPVETVKQGVQHAVGPLHLSAGEFVDALLDGVAVAFTFVEDCEDEGHRRGGD